jgi:epoxyqueuosine reductase
MIQKELLAREHAILVKQLARRHGFDYCGISGAEFLQEEAPSLEAWLKRGYQGSMTWMERHFDMRLDPRLLVPGARSVISFLINYSPKQVNEKTSGKVSRYAYGEDYHKVIKKMLKVFFDELKKEIGDIGGRIFVDSAPVMDKAWARRSGLGWIGKHTNLIHKKAGSWFFIAECILDLELEPDGPVKDYCGTCTRCLDACPTDALIAPQQIDASKCISYLTIELKEAIPEWAKGKMEGYVFGCDICQEVCPWNRFSKPHTHAAFEPFQAHEMTEQEWFEITEDIFRERFGRSALSRTGLKGMQRNFRFIK